MSLTQEEANSLLFSPKVFVEQSPLEFSLTEPMDYERALRSMDRREEFLITVERGVRNRLRLKYQTRARKIIILARLDYRGRRHRNPPESPYKPGQWLSGTHLHLFREGFDDRIAYDLPDVPKLANMSADDDINALEQFLRFCAVASWPEIQTSI
jgi:hypothetical protein